MTFDEQLAYAKWLAERCSGTDVEYISIFELWEDYNDYADDLPELADEDGRAVDWLLTHATLSITWPTEIPKE